MAKKKKKKQVEFYPAVFDYDCCWACKLPGRRRSWYIVTVVCCVHWAVIGRTYKKVKIADYTEAAAAAAAQPKGFLFPSRKAATKYFWKRLREGPFPRLDATDGEILEAAEYAIMEEKKRGNITALRVKRLRDFFLRNLGKLHVWFRKERMRNAEDMLGDPFIPYMKCYVETLEPSDRIIYTFCVELTRFVGCYRTQAVIESFYWAFGDEFEVASGKQRKRKGMETQEEETEVVREGQFWKNDEGVFTVMGFGRGGIIMQQPDDGQNRIVTRNILLKRFTHVDSPFD